MESRIKLLGHPVHPMLIPFPIGLLTTAAIFDVTHQLTGSPDAARAAFVLIIAGLVGGVLAGGFGLIDFFAIPRQTRAKRIATMHGVGNGIMLLFFGWSLFMRWAVPSAPTLLATALVVLATALAMVTGWLGGELVDRLGVGIDDGAHLNAPSSLSKASAREGAAPAD